VPHNQVVWCTFRSTNSFGLAHTLLRVARSAVGDSWHEKSRDYVRAKQPCSWLSAFSCFLMSRSRVSWPRNSCSSYKEVRPGSHRRASVASRRANSTAAASNGSRRSHICRNERVSSFRIDSRRHVPRESGQIFANLRICGLSLPRHWIVTPTQGILTDTQGLTAFSTSRPALRSSASLKGRPISCRLVTGTPSYKSGIGMAMAGLRPRLT
jgi:hypothetical protein